MKKITLFVVMLVIFAVAVSEALLSEMPVPEGSSIRITLVNQEPDPVEPGSIVDVRFKVENLGSKIAENVTMEILPEYPFSLYSGDAVVNMGGAYARQIGDNGIIIKYRLKVDENAVAGENDLKIRYKVKNSVWVELEAFQINVKPQDAILSVENVVLSDPISPGGAGKLKIELKNMANFFIKDVKVRLNLNGKPLAPIGTTNEQTIGIMNAKEAASIEFNLMAEPDAESNLYQVPIEIKYLDNLGTRYTSNHTTGIVIGGKPELLVSIDSSTIHTAKKQGEVVVKFVNRGLSNVKFLNVNLRPSADYVILSSETVYIGNIDSDDYETADFTIYVKRETGKGKLILPLSIEYRDSTNKGYAQDYNLELKLYSSTQAKKMGVDGGSSFTGGLITIIIVVLGLWLYKKRKFPFNLKRKAK